MTRTASLAGTPTSGPAVAARVAVIDVVSRLWLSTCVSVEESSTQVEVAFTDALVADRKAHLLDERLLDELHAGVVPDNDERVPVLLAISDNGPQMPSKATALFMAGPRIAQHFGRPATPNDQAWVESFFGHLKGENPHLEKIKDPGELERCRVHYNTIRLHEGIGYVTPDDEHHHPPRHMLQLHPTDALRPRRQKPQQLLSSQVRGHHHVNGTTNTPYSSVESG